ncbi:isochorismatase family protein [Streptomyces sp. NPDC058964]|uniref:isochorismatase family protein n=1 Tax=Streptomyces sp. NPDC058964 TaxID=3346681 RepID=UPI0036B28C5B
MSAPSFTADDTAMLLIDHQVGAVGWARSIPFDRMEANALALAKTAKGNGIPLLFASSIDANALGPRPAAPEEAAPGRFGSPIKRQRAVHVMDEGDFASVVGETGRRKLIIAGVGNEVCTVHLTLTALCLGYEVQVVADAGGSPPKSGEDFALRRMGRAGADITSTARIVAELVHARTGERDGRIVPFVTPSHFSLCCQRSEGPVGS